MLTCKRSKFSLPKNVTYLNCAYMSPLLKVVEKAGIRGVRLKRNPIGIQPSDFFSMQRDLKSAFCGLVNAGDTQDIAIIPSASYGIANVTRNVRLARGEHVIVSAEQFPSNYYPWQVLCEETGAELKVVSPEPDAIDRGRNWNLRLLESINSKTRAVAIPHAHWADGTLFDLVAIRQRTREVGALLIIDGTQSVGALPFDIQEIQPDALVCAAYKWLLGPYSIGLAYYGDYFRDGTPIEHNWINRLDSENFSGLVNYESQFQPGASRYSVGEQSNFILVPMALRAIEQLNRWGVSNIQEYCRSISEDAILKLRESDFVIEDSSCRGSHLFGVRHQRIEPAKLKASLDKHRVNVSVRGSAIRISPHVYNDPVDLARLVKALRAALG